MSREVKINIPNNCRECIFYSYWDDYENAEITRDFYFGDSSATPFRFEDSTNVLKPTHYRDCKVNIIDMGIIDV